MKNVASNKILILSDLSDDVFEKNINNDRKIELKPIASVGTINISNVIGLNAALSNKQNLLSGSGIVKINSGLVSYIFGSSSQFVKADGSLDNNSYLTGITLPLVTTALGYTPYNATNPNGYITSGSLSPYLTISSANATYQPIGSYLTSITSGSVITALGYVPYNSSNPNGYISSIPAQSFVSLTGKPTTLSGYGITDAIISNAVITADTKTKITYDSKGLVISGSTLLASDIPTLNQNTTGTASNVTGIVSILNGGTGSSTKNFVDLTTSQTIVGTKTYNDIVNLNATTNAEYISTKALKLASIFPIISGQFLQTDVDGNASWVSLTSSNVITALGYTPYDSANPNGYLSSVPAQTFASLTGKPTTISGYGITDFNSTGDARYALKDTPTITGIVTLSKNNQSVGQTTSTAGFFLKNPDITYTGIEIGVSNPTTGGAWIQARSVTSATGQILTLNPTGGNVGIGISNGTKTLSVNGTIGFGSFASKDLQTELDKKQNLLSGSGFVKVSGNTISYDTNSYLTGIIGSDVTTALGYTPYNATNPNGYITSGSLSPYGLLSGSQSWSGSNTFNNLIATNNIIVGNVINPYLSLKQSTSNQEWRMRVGIGTGATNSTFNLYNQVSSKIALTAFDDGNIMIGGGAYYPETRLGVFGGGGSYGANIDVRGTTGVFTDQATIELEGADYDTQVRSTYLQYMGSSTTGTVFGGTSKSNMSRLVMNGNNNLIYSDFLYPIIFGNNGTEKFRLHSNGNIGIGVSAPSYKLDVFGTIRLSGSVLIPDLLNTGVINFTSVQGDSGNINQLAVVDYLQYTHSSSGLNKFMRDSDGHGNADWAYPSFTYLIDVPTTLSGYGITDAYSTSNPSNYISSGSVATYYAPKLNPIFSGSVVSEISIISGSSSSLTVQDRAGSGNSWQIYAQGSGGKFRIFKNFAGYVDQTPFVIDGATGYIGLNKSAPSYPVEIGGNTNIYGADLIITQIFGQGGRIKIPLSAGVSKYLTSDASGYGTWATIPFSDLGSKPTTISGYGITDFNSLGDARYLQKSNNLSDLGNVTTSRTNLGLGTLATQSGTFSGTSSGTNTGDNAVNTNYSSDYRLANFVAGTHYLSPTGNGSGLTGLTGSQITGNISGNSANVTGIVAIINGGTGSATQNFVDLSNVQTIVGVKTFSSNLIASNNIKATNYTFTDGQYIRNSNVTDGTGILYLDATNLRVRRADNGTDIFTVLSNGYTGIGTINPYSKLQITNFGITNGVILGDRPDLPNGIYGALYSTATGNGIVTLESAKSTVGYGTVALNPNGGNVGIGMVSPRLRVEINATLSNPSALNALPTSGNMMLSDGGNLGVIHGISNYNSSYQGYIQSRNNTSSSIAYPLLLNPLGGNVAIGDTISPYKLHVNGSINSTSLYINSTPTPVIVDNSSDDIYINARVIRNNSATHQDGMYIGYANTLGSANRIFDGGGSNYVGIGGASLYSSGINKWIFGNQTDDGTFAQFAGNTIIKGTLTATTSLNITGAGGLFNQASKFGLDFYQGDTRYVSNGATISTKGNHIFYGNSSDGSISNIQLSIFSNNSGISVSGAVYSGTVTVGFPSTVTNSLFVNTPSLNTSYNSGFGVDGSYTNPSGVGTSIINLKAFGVYSGGGYDSSMAFWTGIGTTLTEKMRIASTGHIGIGTPTPIAIFGTTLHISGSTGSSLNLTSSTASGYITASDYLGAFNISSNNTLPISFGINSSEKMRILNSGNVGIGTTTPTTKLEVQGAVTINPSTSANNYIQFKNSGTSIGIIGSDTSIFGGSATELGIFVYGNNPIQFSTNSTRRMVVDGSGNVGIGTTVPLSKLHISSGKIIAGTGTAVNGSTVLEAYYNQDGTYGALATLGTNQSSGGWTLNYGLNPTSTSDVFTSTTQLALPRTSFIVDSDFRFLTAPAQTTAQGVNVTSLSEKFRITNSGKVGVGSTNPLSQFHVVGTNGASDVFRLTSNITSSGDWVINPFIYGVSNGGLSLNNKLGATIPFVIATNDNIGIGTTSPIAKIHIDKATQTIGATTPSGAFVITDLSGSNFALELGTNTANGNWIQSRNATSATFYNLLLNPSGGNVGIGTTSPVGTLHIGSYNNGLANDLVLFAPLNNISTGNSIKFDMNVGGGVARSRLAEIQSLSYQGAGYNQLRFNLGIWNNNQVTSNVMTLQDNGNVGIGTNAPTQLLDIFSSTTTSAIKVSATLSSANSSLQLYNDVSALTNLSMKGSTSASNFASPLGNGSAELSTTSTTGLIIGTRSATPIVLGTNNVEVVRVLSSGNVGIGITAPTSTLHTNGSDANSIVRITSATTLSNNYYVIADGTTNYTITLPTASTCMGRTYSIKTIKGNKTVSAYLNLSNSSDTVLYINTVLYLVSDGSAWLQF